MLTLSYGFKKPETDDTGDVWFPAMAANMQQLNDHSHNGTDSARLTATTQSLLAASWSADLGGGSYRQLVTMPAGLTFDAVTIEVRLSNGTVIHPTITKVSSTTFYVYVNDNTLDLTVVYGS